jgi:hypothetical protein
MFTAQDIYSPGYMGVTDVYSLGYMGVTDVYSPDDMGVTDIYSLGYIDVTDFYSPGSMGVTYLYSLCYKGVTDVSECEFFLTVVSTARTLEVGICVGSLLSWLITTAPFSPRVIITTLQPFFKIDSATIFASWIVDTGVPVIISAWNYYRENSYWFLLSEGKFILVSTQCRSRPL